MKISLIFALTLLCGSTASADCQLAKADYKQAMAYKNSQDYQQALIHFKQSIKRCPRYASYFQQGKTLVKFNQLDDAIGSYTKALNYSEKGSTEKTNLLANMAVAYLKNGQLQQASVYAEQAYQIKKQHSAQNILKLRKTIDLKKAQHIATADEISQALSANRAFGVQAKVRFNSITFKLDSTELTTQGAQQIAELSKVLNSSLIGNQQALLVGHTDKQGEEGYNLTLSRERAEAVKQTLLKMNPALKGLLKTEGKGENELRYPGDSKSDHQLNRRVEMRLL